MQSNKISFKGQNVFVGIDVHLKNWHVTAVTESGFKYQYSLPADAEALFNTLNRKFPGAHFKSAYEAGFSGFATHYALTGLGVENIVVNAADIPTTEKEKLTKTDAVDSEKIAMSLKRGELTCIHIKSREYMDDTNLVRLRSRLIRDLTRMKSRTKHLLYTQGVMYPERFRKSRTHWSRNFMRWLREDVQLLSSEKLTLELMCDQVEDIRRTILRITREIRRMSQSPKYQENYSLLTSVPGIGLIVAMSLLTEIDNAPENFASERAFVSFLGLIPIRHSTGDKDPSCPKTHRGNKQLGPLIIEASWMAIQKDIALGAYYGNCRQWLSQQKAIIKVARKLACKTFAVLKTRKRYEMSPGE